MDISLKSLEEAVSIRRQIAALEQRLGALLGGSPSSPSTHRGKRRMSPQARSKIAAAMRARWARKKRQGRTYLKCKEHGRDHTGWKKEAFAANEGTVGGKEKSCRRQKITYGLRPLRVCRPAVDCLNLSKAGWSWGVCVSDCLFAHGS